MATDEKVPEDFYYTKEHEWVKVEDSKVIIGISDFAQEQLGDVVFVELPEVGQEVRQKVEGGTDVSELGTVESIKTVSEIYSPVSGEVTEVNGKLEDEPELVNEDPYGEGWLCAVDPSDLEEELEHLMDAEAYEEFLESEE